MITEVQVPYEILIRFGEDGSFRGAHAQMRRIVTLDGEVLKDEALPATPLVTAGFDTSEIMTTAAQSAMDVATDLAAQLAAVSAERDALADQLSALQPV
jgi:hypothetical protein